MKDFIAVLVLYKQNLFESKTFITLSLALEKTGLNLDLIIYDNSPIKNLDQEYNNTVNINLTYIHDSLNAGVSKAYNIAAAIGVKKNKKWIILFDQDSNLPDNIFLNYISSINNFSSQKLFAPLMVTTTNKVISPSVFKFNRGFYAINKSIGLRSLNGYSLINSGLCISLDVFKKLGGYNEIFMLDYSDHDFVNRYKNEIGNTMVILASEVQHTLSSNEYEIHSDLKRFRIFNKAVLDYSKIHKAYFFSLFALLIRCFKLSLLHKTFAFIKIISIK